MAKTSRILTDMVDTHAGGRRDCGEGDSASGASEPMGHGLGRGVMAFRRSMTMEERNVWYTSATREPSQAVACPAEHLDREALERAVEKNSLFAGPVEQGVRFAHEQRANQLRFRLSSVYLGATGRVFVLRPHTHNQVARNTLVDLGFFPEAKYKGSFHDLVPGGMLRAQLYEDGVGCSIDLAWPPAAAQIESLEAAFTLTEQRRFVAEIYCRGQRVATISSIRELRPVLQEFRPLPPVQGCHAGDAMDYIDSQGR